MPVRRPTVPGVDPDIDAARVLLHRATAVVRSAAVGAAALDPPRDADARREPAFEHVAVATEDRFAARRAEHGSLLEGHLSELRSCFQGLAGAPPPDRFEGRGGVPPPAAHDSADAGPRDDLWSDIRRTEWAAFGLDAILQTYAERAPRTAIRVRGVRGELRAGAVTARAGAP